VASSINEPIIQPNLLSILSSYPDHPSVHIKNSFAQVKKLFVRVEKHSVQIKKYFSKVKKPFVQVKKHFF